MVEIKIQIDTRNGKVHMETFSTMEDATRTEKIVGCAMQAAIKDTMASLIRQSGKPGFVVEIEKP